MTERDVRLFLTDMQQAAEAIAAAVAGLSLAAFAGDRMRQKAVIHDFLVLGEAASRIPAQIRDLAPEVPWRDMVAMRNKLIHAYFGVEVEIVFRAATVELPGLRDQLEGLCARLDAED